MNVDQITTPKIIVLTLGEEDDVREYELVPFLESGEPSIDGDEMLKRTERLNAKSGEDDGRFILDHRAEIPANLREKIALVFTAWRRPGRPRSVACFRWDGRRWVHYWRYLGLHWDDVGRLVRRRLPTGEAGK